DAFAEVKTNGQILMQMIDNILDTARIEAGRMELRKQYVDVGDIARSVAGRLSFLAIKKDISIDITISPDVSLIRADEDKIRRIIENLLSNAIKYTGNGGR
ncbi:MAG: histidine kinase, partial [Raoultibacter sp.]